MPRYIDADAVNRVFVDELGKIPSVVIDERIEWVAAREAIIRCARGVAAIPTADVHERKVGKWKLNREGNWACPFCEFDPYHDEMNGMNYCPNCGARLEGFDNGKVH